jgi:hypothetical protein
MVKKLICPNCHFSEILKKHYNDFHKNLFENSIMEKLNFGCALYKFVMM